MATRYIRKDVGLTNGSIPPSDVAAFEFENTNYLPQYIADTSGTLRTLVNTDQAQVLINKDFQQGVTAITASGAIAPHTAATYIITKAGVAAMTLAAPTATTDDGVIITITSSTANAHTITATGLLYTGSAATDVATFNAQKGASLKLMAYNAKWQVLSANGVSFS